MGNHGKVRKAAREPVICVGGLGTGQRVRQPSRLRAMVPKSKAGGCRARAPKGDPRRAGLVSRGHANDAGSCWYPLWAMALYPVPGPHKLHYYEKRLLTLHWSDRERRRGEGLTETESENVFPYSDILGRVWPVGHSLHWHCAVCQSVCMCVLCVWFDSS